MKCNSLGTVAAAMACLAMALPPEALASGAAVTNDIALSPGGLLVGQIVNPQGVAKAGTAVSIRFADREVVRTTTDANGVFAAQGLRGGQYQLVTEDGIRVCRLWAPNTAPPAAQSAALVVTGDPVVRGMPGMGPVHSWVGWMKAHPYITAGTIAAAIAVPLAFIDDDSGS